MHLGKHPKENQLNMPLMLLLNMINIKFLQCFQIPRFWTRCFFKKKLGIVGRLCLSVLRVTKLASVKEVEIKLDDESSVAIVECNNLTIINLILRVTGPMKEQTLTMVLLGVQVFCSLLAFTIRYPLAFLLYGEIIA